MIFLDFQSYRKALVFEIMFIELLDEFCGLTPSKYGKQPSRIIADKIRELPDVRSQILMLLQFCGDLFFSNQAL